MARLLIVDDEVDVREFAANFFRKRNIECITVSSGEEALSLLKKQRVDLILLDIKMHGIDGLEALKQIKEQDKNMKVIMVTGRKPEEEGLFEKCRAAGALAYVHKPMELDELERIVMKELTRAKRRHKKMAVDYKKELEGASRTMILVHEPDTLIKMIVRMIVQKVRVSHAGILLHDKEKDTYVLTVSRGEAGLKIPGGFARMDSDNALIRFFREGLDKKLFNERSLVYEDGRRALKNKKITARQKQVLKNALYQMEIFDAQVSIPSYFGSDLLGLLFMGKKRKAKAFGRDEIDFFSALASDVAMALCNARLFKELEEELERKRRLFIQTTIALAAAIDAKDHYTHGHTSRVTALSLKIAKKLSQRNKAIFHPKFMDNLHIASLLHDIGKIGVPESILNKEGPLNDEERRRMEEHPLVGVTILEPIKELQEPILGVKCHHERYDGSGYPQGLKGKDIPLIASIISVADSFDAMITDRPYRKGLSEEKAIEEIKRVSGKQFDAKVASALLELYEERGKPNKLCRPNV